MGIVQLETAAGGPPPGQRHRRRTLPRSVHSALPLEQARIAVREFCRTGGARPQSVTWVRGDFTGAILQPLPDVVA
ncbi:Imm1 family immunity protein [Actinopolyspora mzabensis]|uniref:Imm1 family immunity protein n=1 Tax=Actinopolyspora mzabensis TaxID=995066 RepID=UPI001FDF519B|nr:Imm1 family immunity protein [Actinopolyspora mzabensis]